MTRFSLLGRRLSHRKSKSASFTTWPVEVNPTIEPIYEYPSEKQQTADKRCTARFTFVPQPEQSLDAILDGYGSEEPRASGTTYAGEPCPAGDSLAPLNTHNGSPPKRSGSVVSRRRSVLGITGERRGSLATMMCDAAAIGDLAQVGRLVGAGAKVEKRAASGATPAHLAATGGHLSVLKSLVMHGAKLDVTDGEGRTPLHAAVIARQTDVIPFLVSHGSPIEAKDSQNRTAMDYAQNSDFDGQETLVDDEEAGNRVRFSYVFGQEMSKKDKRASMCSATSSTRRRSIERVLRDAAEAQGVEI